MPHASSLLRWLAGVLVLLAGCAGATRSHKAALRSVDEDEIAAAAEKDSFPAAIAPAR